MYKGNPCYDEDELRDWVNSKLGPDRIVTDMCEELNDGRIMAELIRHIEESQHSILPRSKLDNYFKKRENIDLIIRHMRESMGITVQADVDSVIRKVKKDIFNIVFELMKFDRAKKAQQERERQRELEIEQERERQRQLELERERERQRELEIEQERERQRQLELQRERERQRELELLRERRNEIINFSQIEYDNESELKVLHLKTLSNFCNKNKIRNLKPNHDSIKQNPFTNYQNRSKRESNGYSNAITECLLSNFTGVRIKKEYSRVLILIEYTQMLTDKKKNFNIITAIGLYNYFIKTGIHVRIAIFADIYFRYIIVDSKSGSVEIQINELFELISLKRFEPAIFETAVSTMNEADLFIFLTSGFDLAIKDQKLWIESVFNNRNKAYCFFISISHGISLNKEFTEFWNGIGLHSQSKVIVEYFNLEDIFLKTQKYCDLLYPLMEGRHESNSFIPCVLPPDLKPSTHLLNPVEPPLIPPELSKVITPIPSLLNNPSNSVLKGVNPSGEIFDRDILKGKIILICMFWSYDLCPEIEEPYVHPKYLSVPYSNQVTCIKETMGKVGIEIDVVCDYKEGIEKMCSGKFYSVWIISGCGHGQIPSNGNPHLVIPFIDCAIEYWTRGGTIVLWADNEPYVYEANLFLQRCKMNNKEFTKLKLVGNDMGTQKLKPGDVQSRNTGVFEKVKGDIIDWGEVERYSLSYNLLTLDEGETISHPENEDNISPFMPFARNSSSEICSLYYLPPFNSDLGDIVIDCGYTKLFYIPKQSQKDDTGTSRYINNIAFWGLRTEKIMKKYSFAGLRKPINIKFRFDYNQSYICKFIPIIIPSFDVLFVVDGTGSMGSMISAVTNKCCEIAKKIQSRLSRFKIMYGSVFYYDPQDSPDYPEVFNLTSSIDSLQNWLRSKGVKGGGGDEDWSGCYNTVLNSISWRNDSQKIIFHLADAGEHYENMTRLERYIRQCIEKKIMFRGFCLEQRAINTFKNVCDWYSRYQIDPDSPNAYWEMFSTSSSSFEASFVDFVVQNVIGAAYKR